MALSVAMAKQRESAGECDETAALREEVASLRDHVRLLVDAIDEVREELQWLTRNGLPSRESPPPSPVLKRMAADPCADDWDERLVIERGEQTIEPPASTDQVEPDSSPPASRSSGQLF